MNNLYFIYIYIYPRVRGQSRANDIPKSSSRSHPSKLSKQAVKQAVLSYLFFNIRE